MMADETLSHPMLRDILYAFLVVLAGYGSAMAQHTSDDPRLQSPEEQGWLHEHLGKVVENVDLAGVKGRFDEWAGIVDGKLLDVVAGYEFADPSVGELFVSHGDSSLGARYETPTHDGPITIEGERDGVLILRTEPGRYEISDDDNNGRHFANFSDEKRFYFDLRTLRFINH